MRGRWLLLAAVVVVLGAGALGTASWMRRGFSARDEPSAIGKVLARQIRRWSVPARARSTPNPVPASPAVLEEAREHFADHCASCHANDGSGQTPMGRHLYPRAPDMRAAETQ